MSMLGDLSWIQKRLTDFKEVYIGILYYSFNSDFKLHITVNDVFCSLSRPTVSRPSAVVVMQRR